MYSVYYYTVVTAAWQSRLLYEGNVVVARARFIGLFVEEVDESRDLIDSHES